MRFYQGVAAIITRALATVYFCVPTVLCNSGVKSLVGGVASYENSVTIGENL